MIEFLINQTVVIGLLTVFYFFMRNMIRHLLSKERDKIKHEFEIIAKKSEIIFSTLHVKRVNIITTIYEKLLFSFEIAKDIVLLQSFKADRKDIQVEEQKLFKAINEFSGKFKKNKIWLSPELSKKISDSFDNILLLVDEVQIIETTANSSSQRSIKATEALQEFEKKAPELLNEIESEFRSILGVKTEEFKQ